MKHIFVVHSNITYLSALGVIAHERLALDSCWLISDGYHRQTPVPVSVIAFIRGLKANRWNLRTYFNPVAATDRQIARWTQGEAFTAYVSVITKPARLVITHPQCEAFHFIEDGILSLRHRVSLSNLSCEAWGSSFRSTSILDRLRETVYPLRGYTERLRTLPVYYNAYFDPDRRYYGLSPYSDAMAAIGTKICLSFERIAAHFSLPHTLDLTGCTVWLSDCVDDTALAERYFEALEQGFIKAVLTPQQRDRILVKFHPREQAAARQRTLDLFARYGVGVEVIADTVILEIELLHTHSATLYGTYSSLLYYGASMGHSAWSIDRYYTAGACDKMMPDFWKLVHKL